MRYATFGVFWNRRKVGVGWAVAPEPWTEGSWPMHIGSRGQDIGKVAIYNVGRRLRVGWFWIDEEI